jgi:hypothetical protein
MYFLIEMDEEGNEKYRYNLETDKTLTRAKLVTILKRSVERPGSYNVTTGENSPHPSEGFAPGEHMDIQDLIYELQDGIAATGLDIDKSDYARIALLVSQLFKDTYGIAPRSISRPLKNNPQVWASRKQAYPPGPFMETARQAILAYCVDRMALVKQQRERKEYLDRVKGG